MGDIILKVAQGNSEPVDLTGYVVEDAVKLIRGSEGTEVKLTLKKADGSIKTVSLVRAKIVQEETFARSAIVKEGPEKIGYIYLPEFYADFEHVNGARCSVDVANEIKKLKVHGLFSIGFSRSVRRWATSCSWLKSVSLWERHRPLIAWQDGVSHAHSYSPSSYLF